MQKKGAPKGTVSLGAPLFCSIHRRVRKKECMDIIITFGVRGKIEPKNGPQRNGFFGGLLKKRLLLSGDSKSLALLGYCYTIEGHHLILHCQNWWTLPLKLTLLVLGQYVGGKSSEIAGSYCPPPDFQKENKKKGKWRCSTSFRRAHSHAPQPHFRIIPQCFLLKLLSESDFEIFAVCVNSPFARILPSLYW